MKERTELTTSEKIKTILANFRWKQIDLAEVLKVSQKSVSYWVRDAKEPGLDNVTKINIVLELSKNPTITKNSSAKLLVRGKLEGKQGKKTNIDGISREDYYAGKEYVFEQEKNNKSKIYLYPAMGNSKDNWYRAAGKSLLFYKFILAIRLGRSANTQIDGDKQFAFRHGYVAIKNGELLATQAAKLDYKVEKIDHDIFVIDMGKDFSQHEIEILVEQEKAEIQAVENMVRPKHNIPKLAAAIRTLSQYIPLKIEKIPQGKREVMARQLMEPAVELVKFYHRFANGDMAMTEARLEMLRRTDDLSAVMVFLEAGQMLETAARTNLGKNILEVRHQIEENLKPWLSRATPKE